VEYIPALAAAFEQCALSMADRLAALAQHYNRIVGRKGPIPRGVLAEIRAIRETFQLSEVELNALLDDLRSTRDIDPARDARGDMQLPLFPTAGLLELSTGD
jgi:hypothetical protein